MDQASVFLPLCLSASAGVRCTIGLFLLSLHLHGDRGEERFLHFIGEKWFLVVMGVLMVAEVVIDKLRGTDQILHCFVLIGSCVTSALVSWHPHSGPYLKFFDVALGMTLALIVQETRAGVRGFTISATGRFGNGVLSLFEDSDVQAGDPLLEWRRSSQLACIAPRHIAHARTLWTTRSRETAPPPSFGVMHAVKTKQGEPR